MIKLYIYKCVALVCLLGMTLPAFALDIDNVRLEDNIQLEKYSLVLNGAGVRKRFGLKGFIGALYLEKKMHTPEAVLEDPGAKRMSYVLLRDVGSQTMLDKINEAIIANNSIDDMKQLEARFNRMEVIFRDMKELKHGDIIFMDYIPGVGMRIMLNGKLRGTIEGEDFYRSILKNWLGDRPVQASLKKNVLGQE